MNSCTSASIKQTNPSTTNKTSRGSSPGTLCFSRGRDISPPDTSDHLATLQGAAEERRDSAADTTEGEAKGITKGQSVEYGAFNLTRADGSILIAYVAGRADINDILEDLIEAHIKHTVATTGLTYTQLGNTIKDVEKHLPPVTMPDGKTKKLTLLPAGKTEYTQQNIIEAYSKLALANFSIRAANPATLDRFTADPLGERIVHTVRTEARRYARVLGDKTPQEQAMNASASAESIINAVDKYLHRPDKPVSRRHRNQLTKLRSIIEKYAQIIASGTPRSFKRISPAEQQELEAAIAERKAAELDTAETDPALLIEDNKRTREARSRERHRAIVREAAKGRVYKVLAAMLDTAADALDDYLKDQLLTKLHRITAPVKIKRTPSGRLKGKMTAPIYRKLEQAIQFMALSPRAHETAIDDIFTAQETLARAINEGSDNLTSGNALLIQLADQLTQDGIKVTPQTLTAALTDYSNALAIYGDIESKNYEQTRIAANALLQLSLYQTSSSASLSPVSRTYVPAVSSRPAITPCLPLVPTFTCGASGERCSLPTGTSSGI